MRSCSTRRSIFSLIVRSSTATKRDEQMVTSSCRLRGHMSTSLGSYLTHSFSHRRHERCADALIRGFNSIREKIGANSVDQRRFGLGPNRVFDEGADIPVAFRAAQPKLLGGPARE